MSLPAPHFLADVPASAPAGVDWIDLKTAAARAGYSSDGVIRRFHLPRFIELKLARLDKPLKGKSRWLVREDADPKFARVKSHDRTVREWESKLLTEAHRNRVLEKVRIVQEAERFITAAVAGGSGRREATEAFASQNNLSRATLYLWLSAWRKDGPAGLEDGRSTARAAAVIDDPFFRAVRELWLTKQQRTKTVAWELACQAAKDQGWEIRSFPQTKRHLASLEKNQPAVVTLMRKGKKAYTDQCEPFIQRDHSTLASNQVWVGDTHTFDVWVNDRGTICRPFVTAWEDARSRKITGWLVHSQDATAMHVLLSFRHGIHPRLQDCGVPDELYVDNGKTYDCWVLQGETKIQRRQRVRELDGPAIGGIFGNLGVEVTHCEPHHGQSKDIERFFLNVKERFSKTWETYSGGTTAEKPDDILKKIKAGACPRMEDFVAGFGSFVAGYNARAHGGQAMDRQTPQQVWIEQLASKRTIDAGTCDVMCLPFKQLLVHQNGITLNGISYGAKECVDHGLLNRRLIVRYEPDNLARVSLWDESGRFVCLAGSNQLLDYRATHEHASLAIKAKRQMSKARRTYADARPRMHLDVRELANMKAAEDARAAEAANPTEPIGPSLKPVQTPLTAGAKAYQTAIARRSLRIAVGAESLLNDSYQGGGGRHDGGGIEAEPSISLGGVSDYLKFRPEVRDE